jgi:L-gulonate 5-dehydrogenase
VRQVVLEQPRSVVVRDASAPRPGPGQALVHLRAGGICGSDLSAYRGTSPLVSYPRVLGHELLVDVVACSDRPELEGQRAVVEPLVPCGRCRACRRGRTNCCADLRVMGVHVDGGLAEMTAIDARQLHRVPDGMSDDVAVLAEPLTIAYHAVQRGQPDAGQVAVVLGAGTIGLLIANLLLGARGLRVLVVDVDPWRLEVAERIGATPVRGGAAVAARAVAAATGGEMADVVFEATGNAECTRMTTELVAHAGRVVLIGWNKGPTEVDTVALIRKEVDLLGSRNSADAFGSVLRLLADGMIQPDTLITHRFALGEAAAALRLLDAGGERALKILLADA